MGQPCLLAEGEGHFSEISITLGTKDFAFRQEMLKAHCYFPPGRARQLFCHVSKLLKHNDSNHRQADPGIKISPVAFGKD